MAAPAEEWLEPDGLGGFASGTASGIRTRRYHALLLTARTPPTGRMVLVNGFDAFVETDAGRFAISSQAYAPDVVAPDGASRVIEFEAEPWPRWTLALPDGTRIVQELFVPKGAAAVAMSWRRIAGSGPASLEVRPFFSGRDYHALHHENPAFRFESDDASGLRRFRPYDGVPPVLMRTNGDFAPARDWYRRFVYAEEKARGLDFTEDLASPAVLRFRLNGAREAVLLMAAEGDEAALGSDGAENALESLRARERTRRLGLADPLERAADAYLVQRAAGQTIVAGYPWFTDWGRDTFIAIRGLCLSTRRFPEAERILVQWAGSVSEGMLPNYFPDAGNEPEYNSVDASLWYVVAVHDYLTESGPDGRPVTSEVRERLASAIEAILSGYSRGTRFGIRADEDGLLASGAPGVALTWMDARVDGRPVTQRAGKPVEVQALWINALRIASAFSSRWQDLHDRALRSFRERFWNAEAACLFDVVDPDGARGTADPTFRPNQIYAVGGLPFPVLEGERARKVVDAVEARLVTPMGLRSLDPQDSRYVGRYEGGPAERDAAYHQGTVWPFLIGPFVEAWLRVHGPEVAAREQARRRFLETLLVPLGAAGTGSVPEIADGEAPHTPRGCPFQAWSVGELIRAERLLRPGSPG
jgi:predicted glycogen debranching enzyme